MRWQDVYSQLIPFLCPAGNGVYTVSTGAEKKIKLQELLYASKNSEEIREKWLNLLKQGNNSKTPFLLGIASDSGGGIQRGANWGPLFLRDILYKNIQSHEIFDLGDIRIIPQLLSDELLNQATLKQCRNALYNDDKNNYPVSPLSITEKVAVLLNQLDPKVRLLAFGGDHSVSYPLIKAFLQERQRKNIISALIHFDAHTDLLDKRLGIDICFGTWSRHILQYLPSPDHLIQIGIRASNKNKQHWEQTLGIHQYWANEVEEQGPNKIAHSIISQLKEKQIAEVYVTVDIDVLDQLYASATGTPEPNGLSPTDIITIINLIGENIPITGADLMEVAPFVSSYPFNPDEPMNTLDHANNIVLSLIKNLS